MAAATRPTPPTTVKAELIVVGVSVSIVTFFSVWEILAFPLQLAAGHITLPGALGGFSLLLGQGLWLTMDRRRRGLTVGLWRYGAIFLGPLAVWAHLLLEYRLKALYLIPLSCVPYFLIAVIPYLIAPALVDRM
jgi:hypothetical protein